VNVSIYLCLTVLSGLADGYGFSEASRIWREGSPSVFAIVRSGIGYALGIILYWLALRFVNAAGVTSASVQTLSWFVITIIGVAVLSGDFKEWDVGAYMLAVVAIAAVAGLLIKA
jgi:hypothetical protein